MSEKNDWNTLELLQRIVRNTDRELDRPKADLTIHEGIPEWVHVPMLTFLSNTMTNTRHRHIIVPGIFATIEEKPTPVDVILLATSYQDKDDHIERAVHVTLLNRIVIDDLGYHERLNLVGFVQRENSHDVGVIHGMVIDKKPVINTHQAIAKATRALAVSFEINDWSPAVNETVKED